MNNISFSLFDDALSYLLAITCKYSNIIKHLILKLTKWIYINRLMLNNISFL